MYKVAIIAPKHYVDELREYFNKDGVELHYYYEERLQKSSLEATTKQLLKAQYDSFIGLVDWSSLYAAYLNNKIGAPSPAPKTVAMLQDKYQSRNMQRKYGLYHNVAEDIQDIVGGGEDVFPLFCKPRRAAMSYKAGVVSGYDDIKSVLNEQNTQDLKAHNKAWIKLYEHLGFDDELKSGVTRFVVETLLPHGLQVTLDGFSQAGRVRFFGVTKSVFLPNHISFKRFDYPYHLPKKLRKRVLKHARKFVRAAKFDNSLFNIEYKIDLESGEFALIEINTRPSSQFMYPIMAVMGVHPLDVLIDISLRKKVKLKPLKTRHLAASVCVFRQKSDAIVSHYPSADEMGWFTREQPLGKWKLYAQLGERLSDYPNDSHSYRYAEAVVLHASTVPVHNFEDELKSRFDATIGLN